MGKDVFPYVSSIIVVRNEESRIAKCLDSLLFQDYPVEKYEIIIVDGNSSDSTLNVVRRQIELAKIKRIVPEIRIVNNPKYILASGWNIGIREARGEYVIRLDAHAYVDRNFISKNVEVMMKIKDAACVGGKMITLSDSKTGEIIKEALSNPFGVGGSKFRCSEKAGYVDTVAYGLYRKSVFEEIGYFNELLVRTQDNDLHRRMRDAGMKFYLDPEIRSYYYSRDSYKKLVKQQFNNGKWTMINFLLRPGKMSIRHFIPLLFVSIELLTVVCGGVYRPIWIITLSGFVLHLICGLYFALKRKKALRYTMWLPVVFLMMHIAYGCGSINGMLTWKKLKRSIKE